MKLLVAGCAGALASFVGGAVLAHHSFAMFDQTKQLPLKGTVLEFQWTNPHAFIQLDVPETARSFAAVLDRAGMQKGFVTARMYRGAVPSIALDGVFAVTTLELG